MTRQLELLVLLAIGAMAMASTAAAQASQLHANSPNSVSIFGVQTNEHVLSTDLYDTIRCKEVSFEGTAAPTAQELTLTSRNSGCLHWYGAPTITMNGCKYTITNKSAQGSTSSAIAYVDITGCTSGKQIEITLSGGWPCAVRVPEQHSLSHVSFENKGSEVLANITLTGITYQGHGLCPGLSTEVVTHNGQYTGQATFKARQDVGSQQVSDFNHQYSKLIQNGPQVNLMAT